jgi:hypothetical protein
MSWIARIALFVFIGLPLMAKAAMAPGATDIPSLNPCTAGADDVLQWANGDEPGAHGRMLEQVRLVPRAAFLPNDGYVELYLFGKTLPGVGQENKLRYRIIIVSPDGQGRIAASQVIDPNSVRAEPLESGASDVPRTGTSEGGISLRFNAQIENKTFNPWWRRARVYLVGCRGNDASEPVMIGMFETTLAIRWFCAVLAVLMTLACYFGAAVGTFRIHRSQSQVDTRTELDAYFPEDVYPRGTNFFTLRQHFDPIVIAAGNDGRANAGRLQILFFSLIVFGMAIYIELYTGHLTRLSDNLLLLMGISGLGATLSSGIRLGRGRLHFDNWAWLIHRKWVPRGGVAQLNPARWRDLFNTEGEFDVYRFQMITFSLLVGAAMIWTVIQGGDLGTFEMPSGMLQLLGLSQGVYLLGGLVSPPTVKELDDQIETLKLKEAQFREALDNATPSFLEEVDVLFNENESVKAAKVAYHAYLEAWEKTLTMFSSTLGREVPEKVRNKRPPWKVPNVLDTTRKVYPQMGGTPYIIELRAYGGKRPYHWSVERGPGGWSARAKQGEDRAPRVDRIEAGELVGNAQLTAETQITVKVTDSSDPAISKYLELVITPTARKRASPAMQKAARSVNGRPQPA